MSEEYIREGETVEEALNSILDELGVDEDAIEYEILVEPEKRFIGKNQNAQIRVWLKTDTSEDYIVVDDEEQPNDLQQEGFEDDIDDTSDNGVCADEKQPFQTDTEEVSEEELDRVADTAIDVLRSILKYFDAEEANIDEYEGDEGEIILDVVDEDLAVLIGRHGRTLDALQLLVASAVNRKLGFRYPVVIDIEGYKYRRRQKLEGIAKAAASKAVKQGTSVRLRPMTPYERRIVHITLKDDNRVTTGSEGEEPNRCVVVKLTRR